MRSADGSFRSLGDAEFLEEVVRVGLLGWRCYRGFGCGLFECCRLSFFTYAFELSKELLVGELFRHDAGCWVVYNC